MPQDRNNWREKINLPSIFIESFLIVLSILLALGVNEWRNQSRQDEQRERYLILIQSEIETNIEALGKVIDYHAGLRDSLYNILQSTLLSNSEESTMSVISKIASRGLNPPALQRTAWQAAQVSNVVGLLTNKHIYLLSYIYDLQENGVEKTWKNIAESIFETEAFDEERREMVLTKLYFQIRELTAQEEYLKSELERIGRELGEVD